MFTRLLIVSFFPSPLSLIWCWREASRVDWYYAAFKHGHTLSSLLHLSSDFTFASDIQSHEWSTCWDRVQSLISIVDEGPPKSSVEKEEKKHLEFTRKHIEATRTEKESRKSFYCKGMNHCRRELCETQPLLWSLWMKRLLFVCVFIR